MVEHLLGHGRPLLPHLATSECKIGLPAKLWHLLRYNNNSSREQQHLSSCASWEMCPIRPSRNACYRIPSVTGDDLNIPMDYDHPIVRSSFICKYSPTNHDTGLSHALYRCSAIENNSGDVRDGSSFSSCDESMYMRIARIFSQTAIPTFFVPGENGWLDCTNGDEAYAHWSRHLFRFNEQSGRPQLDPNRYEVRRSRIRRDASTVRSELFSIHMKDRRILMIGLSLPGQGRGYALETSVQGYLELMQDNIRWIEGLLSEYQWADLQGVVLCGHSVGNDYFVRSTHTHKAISHGDLPTFAAGRTQKDRSNSQIQNVLVLPRCSSI